MNQVMSRAVAARNRLFLGFALAVFSLVAVTGCSRPAATAEPVRAVKLMTVGPQQAAFQAEYSAELRARTETRLAFRIGGKLVQRTAEPAQRVKAGQLLATLEAQDLQLAADAAAAQSLAARSQLEVAQADLARLQTLRALNFISAAELERRQAGLQAAQAALEQAQAQAQALRNQLGYARLLATASGVITAVEAEPGQVVSAGQPVLRLAHDGPRDAVFAVAEQTAMTLRVGQPMQARLASTGQPLAGRVREIGASADPVTRTYTVKLALDSAQDLPLGATVHVIAEPQGAGRAKVLRVPTTALHQAGGVTSVWVFDPVSSTVQAQAVQLGPLDGDEVVVTAGLQPGQQVVVAGAHVLAAGQKVSVYGQGALQKPAAAPASPLQDPGRPAAAPAASAAQGR